MLKKGRTSVTMEVTLKYEAPYPYSVFLWNGVSPNKVYKSFSYYGFQDLFEFLRSRDRLNSLGEVWRCSSLFQRPQAIIQTSIGLHLDTVKLSPTPHIDSELPFGYLWVYLIEPVIFITPYIEVVETTGTILWFLHLPSVHHQCKERK